MVVARQGPRMPSLFSAPASLPDSHLAHVNMAAGIFCGQRRAEAREGRDRRGEQRGLAGLRTVTGKTRDSGGLKPAVAPGTTG